jgi:diguanylate cyclase (GGDEF)-like protein
MGSFKIKLVAYFALLSLLPAAAAFWGLSSLAGHDARRRTDARLAAELRSARAAYAAELSATQRTAVALARRPDLQRSLDRGNRAAIERILRGHRAAVLLRDGSRVGFMPPLAARRSVNVLSPRGRIGTVVAYLPLDAPLATRLRGRSGAVTEDTLAIVRARRIVASSPPLTGRIDVGARTPQSTSLGGVRYRVLASPPLALLGPPTPIDTSKGSTQARLLAVLLAMLVVIAVAAYLEGRAIVGTLRGLVDAVNGIARGRFDRRVPVRGRDELAQLARAVNAMAAQLETRGEQLRAERERVNAAVERVGETLAATHEADQLLRVVVDVMVEAAGATSAVLVTESGTIAEGEAGADDERVEVPLAAGRTRLGTLVLTAPAFDEEERWALSSLAAQAAVALENARLHELVERQARVDDLTGLANRRRCEEALAEELARARRFGTPFALVLGDVDDFKTINDRHGHAVGDAVLREVAEVMRATLRDVDLAARWGGEEFVVLLPGTDAEAAAEVAERLRSALAAQLLGAPDGAFRATASFGVAVYPTAQNAQELFETADRSLYRAKTSGKNRVEV